MGNIIPQESIINTPWSTRRLKKDLSRANLFKFICTLLEHSTIKVLLCVNVNLFVIHYANIRGQMVDQENNQSENYLHSDISKSENSFPFKIQRSFNNPFLFWPPKIITPTSFKRHDVCPCLSPGPSPYYKGELVNIRSCPKNTYVQWFYFFIFYIWSRKSPLSIEKVDLCKISSWSVYPSRSTKNDNLFNSINKIIILNKSVLIKSYRLPYDRYWDVEKM